MSAKPPADLMSQFAQLIALAIGGNSFAREQIFLACRPGMTRAIETVLKGSRRDEKTDILHDAYIKLLCALERIEDPTNLLSFAYGVARITAKQYLDKNSSSQMIPMDIQGDESDSPLLADAHLHPFEDIDFEIAGQQVLRKAWPELTDIQKKVYVLKCVHGLTPDEIAHELGIRRNLVDQITFQIKRILQDILARK